MKKILLFLFLLTGLNVFAQDTLSTNNAVINFDATSTGSPEKIEAVSKQVKSKLVVKTGDFVFAIQMQSFEFEKSLMKDHFHENYVESTKFPRATFKGAIQDIAKVNFAKDGKYPVVVKGTMDMHGVKKEVTANGTLTVTGDKVTASSNFKVLLSDFNIEIPKVVGDKIAKQATITVNATYNKK
jgi:polyisoprenoid-binding protein YceI